MQHCSKWRLVHHHNYASIIRCCELRPRKTEGTSQSRINKTRRPKRSHRKYSVNNNWKSQRVLLTTSRGQRMRRGRQPTRYSLQPTPKTVLRTLYVDGPSSSIRNCGGRRIGLETRDDRQRDSALLCWRQAQRVSGRRAATRG